MSTCLVRSWLYSKIIELREKTNQEPPTIINSVCCGVRERGWNGQTSGSGAAWGYSSSGGGGDGGGGQRGVTPALRHSTQRGALTQPGVGDEDRRSLHEWSRRGGGGAMIVVKRCETFVVVVVLMVKHDRMWCGNGEGKEVMDGAKGRVTEVRAVTRFLPSTVTRARATVEADDFLGLWADEPLGSLPHIRDD
ncbi:hypothetical protein Pmani_006109 [Petrolisthes manimaculis]|uniref:Uncharacterized protein n=1 Tax=Petrolisthes manimaculis TaxID=1843537 RepID=A0AAE1QAF9_9EUCA|nr:hypothetical protein Pmani_006109 [Petrolisthes manimaculis]